MSRLGRLAVAAVVVAVTVAVGSTLASAGTGSSTVVVKKGQPVEIAVVLDKSGVATSLTPSIRNAIQMAVGSRTVRGFKIQLNNAFDGPCGDGQVAANASTAAEVITNAQNIAVIGHMCSSAFADSCPSPNSATTTALSIYESFGIMTINGSTTAPCIAAVGPTVFNATAVPGTDDSWYFDPVTGIQGLPSDQAWQADFASRFGSPPTFYADLYFDATKLLLTRLAQVSKIQDGNLVIDRAALATALRKTTGICGVTGTINFDASGYRTTPITAC